MLLSSLPASRSITQTSRHREDQRGSHHRRKSPGHRLLSMRASLRGGWEMEPAMEFLRLRRPQGHPINLLAMLRKVQGPSRFESHHYEEQMEFNASAPHQLATGGRPLPSP